MSLNRFKCDLCKSSNLKKIYSNVADYESFLDIRTEIMLCKNCNLIQQSKIFTENEIKNFYLEDYHGRNYSKKTFLSKISIFLREMYYLRFINILDRKNLDKKIKILDYGSGDGFLCNLLYEKGFENVYSCDFYKPSFSNHKNHIFPEDIHKYKSYFDVMFMINSIEHLISFT